MIKWIVLEIETVLLFRVGVVGEWWLEGSIGRFLGRWQCSGSWRWGIRSIWVCSIVKIHWTAHLQFMHFLNVKLGPVGVDFKILGGTSICRVDCKSLQFVSSKWNFPSFFSARWTQVKGVTSTGLSQYVVSLALGWPRGGNWLQTGQSEPFP